LAREVFLGLWNGVRIPPGLGPWNGVRIPPGLGLWNQLAIPAGRLLHWAAFCFRQRLPITGHRLPVTPSTPPPRDTAVLANRPVVGYTFNMKLSVTLDRDEDGIWVAECPSIPGCVSQGKTKPEALKNIKEAVALCLEVRAERGLPLTMEI
jgi:predicted RNase H-like HicB family nuclease